MRLFDFFKKKERKYVEIDKRIFWYRFPDLKFDTESRKVRLGDIINKSENEFYINDKKLPKNIDPYILKYNKYPISNLDTTLDVRSGYLIKCPNGALKFGKNILDCLMIYKKSQNDYLVTNHIMSGDSYLTLHSQDQGYLIRAYKDYQTNYPFDLDLFLRGEDFLCIGDPQNLSNSKNIVSYKMTDNRFVSINQFNDLEQNSDFLESNKLPDIRYGIFYLNSDKVIEFDVSENLLCSDVIRLKAADGDTKNTKLDLFYKRLDIQPRIRFYSDEFEKLSVNEYMSMRIVSRREEKLKNILT